MYRSTSSRHFARFAWPRSFASTTSASFGRIASRRSYTTVALSPSRSSSSSTRASSPSNCPSRAVPRAASTSIWSKPATASYSRRASCARRAASSNCARSSVLIPASPPNSVRSSFHAWPLSASSCSRPRALLMLFALIHHLAEISRRPGGRTIGREAHQCRPWQRNRARSGAEFVARSAAMLRTPNRDSKGRRRLRAFQRTAGARRPATVATSSAAWPTVAPLRLVCPEATDCMDRALSPTPFRDTSPYADERVHRRVASEHLRDSRDLRPDRGGRGPWSRVEGRLR